MCSLAITFDSVAASTVAAPNTIFTVNSNSTMAYLHEFVFLLSTSAGAGTRQLTWTLRPPDNVTLITIGTGAQTGVSQSYVGGILLSNTAYSPSGTTVVNPLLFYTTIGGTAVSGTNTLTQTYLINYPFPFIQMTLTTATLIAGDTYSFFIDRDEVMQRA